MCADCGVTCTGELKTMCPVLSYDWEDWSMLQDIGDIETLLFKLRDLLSAALPDDLLDEDVSSSLSSSSPDKSSPEPWQDPQPHNKQQLPDWYDNLDRLRNKLQQHQQQASTPHAGQTLPPLKTPAAFQHYEYHAGHRNQHDEYAGHHQQTANMAGYDRGEVEGANSDDEYHHQGNQNGLWNQQSDNTFTGGSGYSDGNYEQQYGDSSTSEQFQSKTTPHFPDNQQHGHTEQHYGPAGDSKPHANHLQNNNQIYIDQDNMTRTQNGFAGARPGYQPSSLAPRPVNVEVQYRGDGATDVRQNGVMNPQWAGEGIEPNAYQMNSAPGSHAQQGVVSGNAQQQFLETANDEHQRQMAQLEILYKAKSRELEQVSKQLESIKEDSAREKRILNHQLAMVNGEKDGLLTNVGQSSELLVACQNEKQRLEEQHQAQSEQMKTLMTSNEQLLEKYQSAQCTIENLAQQLQGLQMSETHSKLSRDRDDLLANIQEKTQQEFAMLREKLDKAANVADEKNGEMKKLEEEMQTLRKTLDQTRTEHAEVVNKLSKSLEESQTQCRQYLESGNLDEVNQLKLQLKQSTATRDMNQEVCKSLQEELGDLQEQLRMYESAASLGVLSSKVSPKVPSESFAHLRVRNLNKEEWDTPKSARSDSSGQPTESDDIAIKLRTELERALNNNKGKRHQIKELQEQLKAADEECEKHKHQAEDAEFKIKEMQIESQMLKSDSMGSLKPRRLSTVRFSDDSSDSRRPSDSRRKSIGSLEARRNTLDLISVKEDCEELKKKLEKEVTDNAQLKQQMVDMVSEHDEDKQTNLDRVQNTCIQLHEDRSKQIREQLVSEWESERDMLKEAHQHQMQEIRNEVDRVQKELVDVKEDYLAICQEKNRIEEEVTKRLKAEAQHLMKQTVAELNSASEKTLADLRQTLDNDHRQNLLNAKSDWQKVADQLAAKQLEIKLAEAHVEWNSKARKQAAESAKQAVEVEWQSKLDEQVKERLDQELTQAKEELQLKYKDDLETERCRIQSSLEEKHKQNLDLALANAEKEWKEKSDVNLKEKLQEVQEDCNKKWLDGDVDTKELIDKNVEEERDRWIRKSVDIEEVTAKWIKERGQNLIEKEVAQTKRSLEEKHNQELVEMQRKYNRLDCERREVMKSEAEKMQEEHAEFLEEHKETMRAAIQATQDKCRQDQADRVADLKGTLAEKEKQWQAERQGLIKSHYQEKVKFEADIENLKQELDTLALQQQDLCDRHKEEIETAISQAKDEYDEELRETYRKQLEQKEETWNQEKEDLKWQLQEAEEHLQDREGHAQQNVQEVKNRHQQIQQQMEIELKDLRKQLRTSQTELHQTEQRLKQELHNLQSQLTSTNSATMGALEGRMRELQKKHARAVLRLKEQHEREKDRWTRSQRDGGEDVDSVSREIQTDPVDDTTSHSGLNELRAHYLSTVEKIRSDVLKYVTDMREQCRQTVHTEVKRERNSTARKLRQYYLKCLHQLTQEEKSNENATVSKFVAMATALELPEDQKRPADGDSSSGENSRPSSRCSSRQGSPRRSSHQSQASPRRSSQQSQGSPRRSSHQSQASPRRSSQQSQGSPRHSSRSASPDVSNLDVHYENKMTKSAFKPIREPFVTTNCDIPSTMPDGTRHRLPSDSLYLETDSDVLLEADPFRRLSRQPREFNPSPERLHPTTQSAHDPNDHAASSRESVLHNVTVRPKVIESSPEATSQEHESSTSIRVASHQRLNDKVSRQNQYIRGDVMTRKDSKYLQEKSVSQLTVVMPKPVSGINNQGQRSRTDLSAVSLATEYNDLPDSLDIENQCPQEYIGKGDDRERTQLTKSNQIVKKKFEQDNVSRFDNTEKSQLRKSNLRGKPQYMQDTTSNIAKRSQTDNSRESHRNVYRLNQNDSSQKLSSITTTRATSRTERTSNKDDHDRRQRTRVQSTSRSVHSAAEEQHSRSEFGSAVRTSINVRHKQSSELARSDGNRTRTTKHLDGRSGRLYGSYQDSGFDSPYINQ